MMPFPILSMMLSETMRLLLPFTVFLMVPMVVQCQNPTNQSQTSTPPPKVKTSDPGTNATTDSMDPLLIAFIVFMTLAAFLLIIIIIANRCSNASKRNKKLMEMHAMIREKKERKRLLYEMQVTEVMENHKRELMASEQRRLINEITEDKHVEPELRMDLYNKEDGYLKVQDIKAEHQKMINAKTIIAARACVAKIVAAMAEVDSQSKDEDLVDVPKERCTNPEVKTLKARQVEIVPVESQDKFKDPRKFNMNYLWVLDFSKAFIGQLPPQEVDLFTIVMHKGISAIVVDSTLMNTYIWKYSSMQVDDIKVVDLIRITCVKTRTMLKTGFVAALMKLYRGDVNRECLMLFMTQMPSGSDAAGMREMEDCCSMLQLQCWDWESIPTDATKQLSLPSLLFLDWNGTGNAVTVLTLYICRQQLFRFQCTNAHFVLKFISRWRYGCWVGMDSLQVAQALGVIYGALEAARKAVVAGDAWVEKKRKKREAKKEKQAMKEKTDQEKSGSSSVRRAFSFRRLNKSGVVDLESGRGESVLSGGGSMSQSSKLGKSGKSGKSPSQKGKAG